MQNESFFHAEGFRSKQLQRRITGEQYAVAVHDIRVYTASFSPHYSVPYPPRTPLLHPLLLLRPLHRIHPAHPLRRKQLRPGLRLVQRVHIIHHARLDDRLPRERVPGPEERAPAVAAEVVRDGVAAVGGFGDGLGRAGGDGEAVGGDDDVGAVGRAGHFAAVEAVADGLLGGGKEVSGGESGAEGWGDE